MKGRKEKKEKEGEDGKTLDGYLTYKTEELFK